MSITFRYDIGSLLYVWISLEIAISRSRISGSRDPGRFRQSQIQGLAASQFRDRDY